MVSFLSCFVLFRFVSCHESVLSLMSRVGIAGAKAIELMSYSFDPAKKVFEKLTEEEVEQFRAGHESTLT